MFHFTKSLFRCVVVCVAALSFGGAAWGQKAAPEDAGPHLVVQTGNPATVFSMAFSPDGKTLVSNSNDITLWDVSTGLQLRTISEEQGFAVFSPDGKNIIGVQGNQTAIRWDALTGREIQSRHGDGQPSSSNLVISPDGKIGAGAYNNTIKLWDAVTGREIGNLNGHTDKIYSLAFSSDGKTLVSGGVDKTIRFWDVVTGRQYNQRLEPAGKVYAVAISPDGRTVASCSGEGRRLDVVDGKVVRTLHDTVKLWDTKTGREIYNLEGEVAEVFGGVNARPFSSLAFSPNGKLLASRGLGKSIKLWNVETGREFRDLTHESRSMIFSPDGKTFASAAADIKLWDIETGRELKTLSGRGHLAWSLSVSPDGKTVVSTVYDRRNGKFGVDRWDTTIGSMQGQRTPIGGARFLSVSPDGQTMVSGDADTTIKLWDVKTGRELHRMGRHALSIQCAAFSPDGKMVVSGGRAGWNSENDKITVKSWDVASGRELQLRNGILDNVECVVWGPDGKTVAASGDSRVTGENGRIGRGDNVKLWEAATGRELQSLKHGNSVATYVGVESHQKLNGE